MSEEKLCPFCGGEVKPSFNTLGYLICVYCEYSVPEWFFKNRPIEDVLYAKIDELVPQCDSAYAPYRDMVNVARAEVDEFSKRLAKSEATNAAYTEVLQDIAHGPTGYWNDANRASDLMRSMMRSAEEVLFHFPPAETK